MTRPRLYIEPRRVVVVGELAQVTAWLAAAAAQGVSVSDWIKQHLPKQEG